MSRLFPPFPVPTTFSFSLYSILPLFLSLLVGTEGTERGKPWGTACSHLFPPPFPPRMVGTQWMHCNIEPACICTRLRQGEPADRVRDAAEMARCARR